MKKHKILFLGPQGSGKGTQALLLAQMLNIPALSMGQLLRDEVATGSTLGKMIGSIINAGHLVSDDIALQVLKKRLTQLDAQGGYILDGYPRNRTQYESFRSFDSPTAVLVITIPNEETLNRLMKRAEIEARPDDNQKAIAKRLEIYHKDTKPIINEYKTQGLVHEIDGMGSVEEVQSRILKALSFMPMYVA